MIIVTGGAGFIGSAIVWRLNQEDRRDILIVDHLGNSDKWKNLLPLYYKDYMEKDEFLKIVEQDKDIPELEAIIHMGARSDTMEKDMSFLIENNFKYSQKVATYAINRGIKFIYASSAATYGTGNLGFDDNEVLLHSLRPLNPYAFSKHIFDLWLYENNLHRYTIGLKFFNVYGPNEYHKGEMRSKVLKAYEEIKQTGKIKLFKSYNPAFGDGEQKRDFIYIKDAVEVVMYLFKTPHAYGIYNVGTGRAHSWLELAHAVFNALGLEPKIEFIDMPDWLKPRYQYFTEAKISKLRRLGYPGKFYTFENAVREYIKEYIEKDKHLGD